MVQLILWIPYYEITSVFDLAHASLQVSFTYTAFSEYFWNWIILYFLFYIDMVTVLSTMFFNS